MKRILLAAALVVAPVTAFAAGQFSGLPIIGSASYCGSFVNAVCVSTIPAGPNFTGLETIPADTSAVQGQSPQTVLIRPQSFGQGASSVVTTVVTATIPANTPLYFLNGTQGSAFTITMPAAPSQNDIQYVGCTAATVGVMTVAANTGQTLIGNPNAACAAGTTYKWVYLGTVWQRL